MHLALGMGLPRELEEFPSTFLLQRQREEKQQGEEVPGWLTGLRVFSLGYRPSYQGLFSLGHHPFSLGFQTEVIGFSYLTFNSPLFLVLYRIVTINEQIRIHHHELKSVFYSVSRIQGSVSVLAPPSVKALTGLPTREADVDRRGPW